MANDLKTATSSAPAIQQDIDPFEEFANQHGRQSFINGDLLRFTKHGIYKAGQEQEEIEEGTRMLAFMPGLMKGQVRWENNSPVKHLVGLVVEGFKPPARETLGDLDQDKWPKLGGKPNDPWQFTFYLPLLDESGQLYTYVTASKGGEQTLGDLVKKYVNNKKMHPDLVPIVKLNRTSYDHPEYGETFKPLLKIDGWSKVPADFDDLKASMNGGDEPELIESKVETFAVKAAAKPKTKEKVVPLARGKDKSPKKGMRF